MIIEYEVERKNERWWSAHCKVPWHEQRLQGMGYTEKEAEKRLIEIVHNSNRDRVSPDVLSKPGFLTFLRVEPLKAEKVPEKMNFIFSPGGAEGLDLKDSDRRFVVVDESVKEMVTAEKIIVTEGELIAFRLQDIRPEALHLGGTDLNKYKVKEPFKVERQFGPLGSKHEQALRKIDELELEVQKLRALYKSTNTERIEALNKLSSVAEALKHANSEVKKFCMANKGLANAESRLEGEVESLKLLLSFAVGVIKSGEGWTPVCEATLGSYETKEKLEVYDDIPF